MRGGLVAVVGEGGAGRLGEGIGRMRALEMGGEAGGGRGVGRGVVAGVGVGVGVKGLRVGVWRELFWLGVKEERRGVRGEELSEERGVGMGEEVEVVVAEMGEGVGTGMETEEEAKGVTVVSR